MNLISKLKKSFFEKKYRSHPLFNKLYREVDLDRKVEDITFCVVDVETTGPNPRRAHIISVGALKIEGLTLKLSTYFHRFVKAEDIKRESIEVHGITEDDLKRKGEPPEDVIKDFLEYVSGTVMVGFNVEFDRKVIERTALEHLGFPLPVPRIDVLRLLKRKGITVPTLESASKELGIPLAGHHSAIDDAYTTALIFLRMVKPFQGKPLSVLPVVF